MKLVKRDLLLSNVIEVAKTFKISPLLLDALVFTESTYDQFAMQYEKDYRWLSEVEKHAVANKTSIAFETELQKTSFGLCQVMGGTARWLGHRKNLVRMFDVETNLNLACTYLKRLEKSYARPEEVIAAYNAGSVTYLDGHIKNQSYVDEVLYYMKLFKSDHD